jgi:hypothetical protein
MIAIAMAWRISSTIAALPLYPYPIISLLPSAFYLTINGSGAGSEIAVGNFEFAR